MTDNHAEFATFIENALFTMPAIKDRVELLSLSGVRGRITPYNHPFLNLTGLTEDCDDIGTALDRLIDFYRSRQSAFGFLIGPNTPVEANALAETRGFQPVVELAGLIKTELDLPGEDAPGIRIEEVDQSAKETWCDLLARCHEEDPTITQFMGEILMFNPDSPKPFRNYVAYLDDHPEPVAAADFCTYPGTDIIYLGGAGTLSEFRGRGIYKAMVRRRFADAKAAGYQSAFIQAMSHSSAPICNSLGFEEVCTQKLLMWRPT